MSVTHAFLVLALSFRLLLSYADIFGDEVPVGGVYAAQIANLEIAVSGPPSDSLINLTYIPSDDRLITFPGGVFDPARAIFPIIKKTPVRGIADTLREVQVLHDFVDSHQYFYQSYKAGDVPKELYDRISGHIDSTVLTSDWVDGITISVLVAEDSSGNRVVIVDRNNDGDFSDEPALDFQPDTLVAGTRRFPVESAMSEVTFEYFEDGLIKRRTAPARFVYTDRAEPADLSWQIAEYPIGTWTVRGEAYSVALGTEAVFRPGRYNFFYVDVEGDGRFDPDPEGLDAYSIAEPFNIGGTGWRIKMLAADGLQVELAREDATVLPRTALREGNPAPDFISKTLHGERVALSDFRGRYVLLNFAATWCAYSRAELPFLKAAYEVTADDEFAMLTFIEPDDPSRLPQYMEGQGLKWDHIEESREDDVARRYRVIGFPTNYLVDPKGVIVAHGEALRGDSLAVTLGRHLTGADLR